MAVGQNFLELLTALLDRQVDFLVVGATAAVLAGVPVTTFDLDVVVEPSGENQRRLLSLLEDLDAIYVDPGGRRISPTADRLRTHRNHLLNTRLGRLDVLTSIAPGWVWGDLLSRSQAIELAGRSVRVLDLSAVIESKEAADRPRDRAALPQLREALLLRSTLGEDRQD